MLFLKLIGEIFVFLLGFEFDALFGSTLNLKFCCEMVKSFENILGLKFNGCDDGQNSVTWTWSHFD